MTPILSTLELYSFDDLKQYVCSSMQENVGPVLSTCSSDFESNGNGYTYGYLCQSVQGYLFVSSDDKYSLRPDNDEN